MLVCLVDGVMSRKIRLADWVTVKRASVPRQKRVTPCPKMSSSPPTATAVGSPIMAAATKKRRLKWIAAFAVEGRARRSRVRDKVENYKITCSYRKMARAANLPLAVCAKVVCAERVVVSPISSRDVVRHISVFRDAQNE